MGGNRQGRNFTVYTKFPEGKRDFFQHDDRGYSGNNYRGRGGEMSQGSRQNYSRGGRGGQNYGNQSGYYGRGNRRNPGNYRGGGGRDGGQRRFFNDEDEPMGEKRSRMQQLYDSSRGSRRGKDRRGGNSRPTVNAPASGWHKIVIKDCASFSNQEILDALSEYVSDSFFPVMMETHGSNCMFYIENNLGLARAIANLSGRINLGDNRKHYISCNDASPPMKKITPPQKEVVKAVMSDRYSVELKRMDFTNFHNDKQLVQNQIFCPLNRNVFLTMVLQILTENCFEVEEIDLSCNSLYTGNGLAEILSLPSLQRLFLQKNKIRHMDALIKLKGLQIQELSLEGNSLCAKYKDPESYTSAVRDIFPKVMRLDGLELSKPIEFEIEDNAKLPPILPSFFVSGSATDIMLKFIEHYFQAFESDNRKALEPAYTDDALMSIATNFPDFGTGARLTSWFEKDNRNLRKVINPDRRYALLCKGRTAISELLCRLPKCVHDPNSFVVDIPFANSALTHVVLTGVFKQTVGTHADGKQLPIRNFMKSMVIIPVGSGFCISNEELFINLATVEQIRNAFKSPSASQVSSPPPSVPTSPAQSSQSSNLEPAQIELVKQFALESKMLPEYCVMCLERNDWDFLKAGEMFVNLQKENKIPPEYFGLPT